MTKIFEKISDKNHEQVVYCNDPSSGLKAIIAIHNTVLGPALGGCRMYPYKSEEEALVDVLRLSREVHNEGKPIGAICIAPAIMATILSGETELTVGFDEQTASDIDAMGAKHVLCPVDEIVVDKEKKVVSTPAYMEAKSIKEAALGIEKLVAEILNMIN